jgi:hypothetical protein
MQNQLFALDGEGKQKGKKGKISGFFVLFAST